MKNVIRSGIVAAVILVMVASTFAISPMNVSASPIIYIKPDGSVDPASAPIIRHGNGYKLSDNVLGSIYVQRPGITLVGNGYTIQGSGTDYGVYLDSVSDVILKNLIVKGFYQNIKLWKADYNKVLKCESSDSLYEGIILTGSSYNVLSGNEATANGDSGIEFQDGNVGSSYNVVSRNKAYGNTGPGITLVGGNTDNLIKQNVVYGQNKGIYVPDGGDYNTYEKNLVYSNNLEGMYIKGARWNLVKGNTYRENGKGLMIRATQYTYYEQNMILNNEIGIDFLRGGTGQNRIQHNWIQGNEIGINLYELARNNEITLNTITQNDLGASFDDMTSNNRIHHNNFIGNTVQLVEEGANIWDDGSYEGNHWSDYMGKDLDRDGVGDTELPHQAVDDYPLIKACRHKKVHLIRFSNK